MLDSAKLETNGCRLLLILIEEENATSTSIAALLSASPPPPPPPLAGEILRPMKSKKDNLGEI